MVVPAPVRATPHRNDPAWVRHLVVHLAQRGRHLVGQSAGDNHDVGLAGGGTENNAEAVLVVAGSGQVHHLDGAAGETEGHGPEGALSRPVCYLVEGGSVCG